MTHHRLAPISFVIILMLGAPLALAAGAQDKAAQTIDRGLESSIDVRYTPILRERSDATRATPVRVRVSRTSEPGVQRVSYIGIVAGTFDLRDYLAREDGRPLDDLQSLPIRVVSHLPQSHGLDLFEGDQSPAVVGGWNWRSNYRVLMLTGLVLWLAVPVVLFARWVIRRPRPGPPPAPAAPTPTLGEQLATVIRSAGDRTLTVDERAELELLLIRYLSNELGLAMVPPTEYGATLQSLRREPRTAPALRAVERWLHAGGDPQAREINASKALDVLAGVARNAQQEVTSAVAPQLTGSTA